MKNELMPALLMSALSLACTILILVGLKKALKRTMWDQQKQQSLFNKTLLVITGWIILLGALALAGFFRNFNPPPRIVLVLLVALLFILFTSFSKTGTRLLSVVPPHGWL
jgi:hypothetical protein